MSATEDASELKGGHPPAVKAGGMRVTQHKPSKHEGAPEPITNEEIEEDQVVVVKERPAAVMISGVESKGDKDFPPQAIKSYHDKPQPTHDKRPMHTPVMQINQPRK